MEDIEYNEYEGGEYLGVVSLKGSAVEGVYLGRNNSIDLKDSVGFMDSIGRVYIGRTNLSQNGEGVRATGFVQVSPSPEERSFVKSKLEGRLNVRD